MNNILVCGAGSVGKRHIKNLISFGENVLVWRERKSKLKEIRDLFGVQTCSDLEKALNRSKAVIIATATDCHVNIAIEALKLKKSVFIEKPVSNNLKNIDQLINLSKYNIVEVGHQLRTHPSIKILKSNIKKIHPRFVMGYRFAMGQNLKNWRLNHDYKSSYTSKSSRGGGALFELVHQIDLAIWMFGPVSKVFAVLDKRSNLSINADDFSNLILKHDNGVTGQIQVDMVSPSYRGDMEVITNKNIFNLDLNNGELLSRDNKGKKILSKVSNNYNRNYLFLNHMKHFISRLDDRKLDPICSIKDGIHSLEILVAAHESNIKEKTIKVRRSF